MAATAPRDAGCSSVLHDEPGSTPATPENGADLERNEAAGFGTPSPTWSPGSDVCPRSRREVEDRSGPVHVTPHLVCDVVYQRGHPSHFVGPGLAGATGRL
ncbi:61f9009c-5807-485e-b1bc-c477c978e173 [Thermothielavioides terrestris]|uniref:61f9009c-5807-485e-b1bc-c477c978e173 n=1 Tax=Thermothielavioides terrestris TaxID=2587410 RepID=A0A446BDL5_9PEZI|nr:61f9009c-5807-485e-b1bc-c477c978e173 [Thermothielavioides terrestris]